MGTQYAVVGTGPADLPPSSSCPKDTRGLTTAFLAVSCQKTQWTYLALQTRTTKSSYRGEGGFIVDSFSLSSPEFDVNIISGRMKKVKLMNKIRI